MTMMTIILCLIQMNRADSQDKLACTISPYISLPLFQITMPEVALSVEDVDIKVVPFLVMKLRFLNRTDVTCCMELLLAKALEKKLTAVGLATLRTLGAKYVWMLDQASVPNYPIEEDEDPPAFLEKMIDTGGKQEYKDLQEVKLRKIVVILATGCGTAKEITRKNGNYLLKRAQAFVAANSGAAASRTIVVQEGSQNPFAALRGKPSKAIPEALYTRTEATAETIEQALNAMSAHVSLLPWAEYLFALDVLDSDIRNQFLIVMTGHGVTGIKNIRDFMTRIPIDAVECDSMKDDLAAWMEHKDYIIAQGLHNSTRTT
jgi:hypothetical protein